MPTALVIGGTGPTGPVVVDGLLERGYEVTIFHGGHHEVEFAGQVRHLHGDPHFAETIAETVGAETFDVVVAQYGRLRHVAEFFAGRTGQVVAIGGATGSLARPTAPVWGRLGRPAIVGEWEFHREDDERGNKMGFRMAQALARLFEVADAGGYRATYIGYPILYGPRQPASREWSIVRRILDGRPFIVLPDGGLKLESRGYSENVALAPLLAVDNPDAAAGQTYVVADREVYTHRQRVEAIAAQLGASLEVLSLPYEFGVPSHPLYRGTPGHRVATSDRVRAELGYTDRYTPDEALERTVNWLVETAPPPGGELEQQLGDPFDYAAEDRLADTWARCEGELRQVEIAVADNAHAYRHPKKPGEAWQRPTSASRPL
jgi:nucleoside-diphosphate-sugar epimerase